MDKDDLVQRYNTRERVNHWIVAITFVLLALSGLALFHPAFFFLGSLLGGGTWSRILHPFIGVVMFGSFFVLAMRFWDHNKITEADRQWGRHLGEFIQNRTKNLPEIGKYNLGQKYLFWTLVVTIPLLMLSGIVAWQPYFAPLFGITVVRIAMLVHMFASFIAIVAIIVHVYAGYWTRGSIRAMIRGTVTAAWAKHHHAAWYKEVSKGDRQ